MLKNAAKGLVPLGMLAVVCIPCLVLVAGISGGVLAAVGGALLTPAVGLPLVVAGLGLMVTAAVWYRRRTCALPPARTVPVTGRRAKRRASVD